MPITTTDDHFEALDYAGRYVNRLFPLDTMLASTDGTAFRFYHPSEGLDLGVKAGDTPDEDDVQPEVIAENKVVSADLPASVYGTPIKTIVAPIHDEAGNTIGTLESAFDITIQSELTDISAAFAETVDRLRTTLGEMASRAETLKERHDSLIQVSDDARQELDNSAMTLHRVRTFTNQTKMLGISARIEASRSGTAAQNFTIVASETRQLSDQVATSAREIDSALDRIRALVDEMQAGLEKAHAARTAQATAIDRISQDLDASRAIHGDLLEVAKVL